MNRSRCLLTAIIGALALTMLPSAALAQSTTMYPSGDSISLSSTPVTIKIPLFFKGQTKIADFGTTTCTLHGGAFTVGGGKKSGPVVVGFVTQPTYTGCTEISQLAGGVETKVPVAITSTGTWNLTVQYGSASVVVHNANLSINVNNEPGLGPSQVTFSGGWDNGFSSPLSVSSAVEYGGTVTLHVWEQGENTKEVTFPQALLTMTDTTHPASLPVIGP